MKTNLLVGGTEVVNVNNGGSGDIQFNSVSTGLGFGTQVMTWSFNYTNATTLSVIGTARDGGASFTTNVTVGGGVSSFELYAAQLSNVDGTLRQPYYNDFAVVPEPSTYALLALSGIAFGGYVIRRRRR